MTSTSSATVRLPRDASLRDAAGGALSIRLCAATGGRWEVVENSVPAGYAGPPLHVHDRIDETFYVIEGELTFRLDDDVVTGGSGMTVHVPRGVPHTFANFGAERCRYLGIVGATDQRGNT